MGKPEWVPNIALVFALVVTGAACVDSKASSVKTPAPRSVQYTPTASAPEAPLLSEKRRKGAILESLDFSNMEGKKLEKNKFYDVGKIRITYFSENYEVIVNPQQLLKLISQCGTAQIKESLSLEISENVFVPNEKGQINEMAGNIASDGSGITILLGTDLAYRNAGADLDRSFEVNPEKRMQAVQNLAAINISKSLVTGLYAAAIGSRINPTVMGRQQAQAEMQKANQLADKYADQLLNGEVLPILQIVRKPKNLKSA